MTVHVEPTPADDLRPKDWPAIAERVAEQLQPLAVDLDRRGVLPLEVFRTLRETGLTSALVPTELGGGGASHATMGEVLRILARAEPSTAVALAMHSHLVAAQVWRHHHGIDASAVLARVAGGALLVSTGASDWVASNGSATAVEGGYRIAARKAPASGCEAGDVLVTSVRWADAPDGPQVIHCAVPFSAEGLRIERTWDTMGLRATGSHTVVLDDVFVPAAAVALVRPADVWHPVWNITLGAALPLIMAAYLGIADAAVAVATGALADRVTAASLQAVGEMGNAHLTAVDLVDAMFRDTDNLHFANTDELAARILSRKTVVVDALIQTVRLAIEASGGYGYSRAAGLERLLRDVHGSLFHPLPRAKQLTFCGRVALGLPPIAPDELP